MSTATQSEIDAMLSAPDAPPTKTGLKAAGPQSVEVDTLLKIEVPVIVKLASRTMSLSEVMSFTLGAILEFDLHFDSELSLMINNKCVGRGTAVKVGENFGLRVTHVATIKQRIKALQ